MSEKVSPNGRAALKESLLQFFVFADALHAREMRDAIEACITVLDTPGPLDKRSLAPWLKVVHERAADVFRQGIEETRGSLRGRMQEGLKQAEEDALWMKEALEGSRHRRAQLIRANNGLRARLAASNAHQHAGSHFIPRRETHVPDAVWRTAGAGVLIR